MIPKPILIAAALAAGLAAGCGGGSTAASTPTPVPTAVPTPTAVPLPLAPINVPATYALVDTSSLLITGSTDPGADVTLNDPNHVIVTETTTANAKGVFVFKLSGIA